MKLDPKIQELIAVGASVTAGCQPCLQYHAAKALENGAGADEVAEAIEVGKTVRRGAAAKLDKFAAELAGAASSGAAARSGPACPGAAGWSGPGGGAGVCCS